MVQPWFYGMVDSVMESTQVFNGSYKIFVNWFHFLVYSTLLLEKEIPKAPTFLQALKRNRTNLKENSDILL